MRSLATEAVLLLLLVGCGPDYADSCEIEGLRSVSAEAPIDCEAMAYDMSLARTLIVDAELAPADFDTGALGILVWSDRNRPWIGDSGRMASGWYWGPPRNVIEMGSDGYALIHELLHSLGYTHSLSEESFTDERIVPAQEQYRRQKRDLR